jgi:hypothetical protein
VGFGVYFGEYVSSNLWYIAAFEQCGQLTLWPPSGISGRYGHKTSYGIADECASIVLWRNVLEQFLQFSVHCGILPTFAGTSGTDVVHKFFFALSLKKATYRFRCRTIFEVT